MVPEKLKYPEFVADQVLTSENLNDLFGYVDEQGRLTRTNLLGIGIACGLEVRTGIVDGSLSITITKGTGVTGEGYLVSLEGTYSRRAEFDAVKEEFYGKFLTVANKKKVDLWELKPAATIEGTVALDMNFLEGKAVLLFVELLRDQNKNCDPQSCDDKGLTVNVNVRPLLVGIKDVTDYNLKMVAAEPGYHQGFRSLDELRMKRFDVAANTITTAADLFTAYRRILTQGAAAGVPGFMNQVQNALTAAWDLFKGVLGPEYTVNPFLGVAGKFAHLNASPTATQVREIQYAYDFFSDLLAAYDEFRTTGMEVLETCCPNESDFPRHLLLDLAVPDKTVTYSQYRHYFQWSPLFQEQDLHGRLKSLFRRMALMATAYSLPAPTATPADPDPQIRITPSRLDPSPLSSKAIPYYLPPNHPAGALGPLYKYWSYGKTRALAERRNLSYHAGDYAQNDFISHPLDYDLEPYNFLRVEGHLGKTYSHAMTNLKNLIARRRLPIDVIALSLGSDASGTDIRDPKAVAWIQTQYEVLKSDLLCCLRKQIEYWGRLEVKEPVKDKVRQWIDAKKSAKTGYSFTVLNEVVGAGGGIKVGKAVSEAPKAAKAAALAAKTAANAANTAAKAAAAVPASHSQLGTLLTSIVGTPLELSLATEYLYLLELGGYRLSQVPEPMTEAFDKSQVSHFAKIILDEMLRIVQLLESESLLTLNLDALGESSGVLKEAIGKLLDLVSRFLDEQRPYAWLRAQMGETQQGRVEAIAQALPAMTESDANKIMQILDNVPTKQADDFVKALQEKKGDAAGKRQVLNDTYAGLDFDGMMIRIPKEVPDDPLLKGIAEKLRNFNCLCILENFGKLRKTFHDLVDEFRQANLFMHFAAKHPGMQHKAGVTMGGTFIIVYQRKGGAHTNGPDNAYRQADAGIDNNVVVADFYLPYLSYSVHPPIVFQMLNGEPAPEAVTLALQPDPQTGNSYSVRDNQPYSFTHSVVNGTLNGGTPANGVTPNGADHFAFTPSALKPRFNIDLKSIPLEFTYTKRGVTSQPVRITVYNEPMVTDVKPSAENLLAGAKVTITATVKFADTFRWMLEMFPATGSPRVVNDSLLTTKDVVNLTLAEAGTYVFTLEVTQSETKEKALSGQVKIFVRMAEQPAPKTCGSLPAIISDYGRIGIIDVKLFPDFNGILTELGINQFFKKLGNMVNDGEAALLAFFSREQDESSLAATLKGWLDRLASIILADKPKGFRPLAMEAYRIILALAMYVSCLRKEDITGEETELYKRMIVHMQGKGVIKGFMDISPEFGTKENKVLTGMRSTVGAEKKRLDSNNKLQEKPAYTKAIKALVAALNEPT